MKVRITKCSRKTYWYYGRVGEIFEVKESKNPAAKFKVVKGSSSFPYDGFYFINRKDCEILPEGEHNG